MCWGEKGMEQCAGGEKTGSKNGAVWRGVRLRRNNGAMWR